MSNDLVFALARVQFGEVTHTKFAQVGDAIQENLRAEYPFFHSAQDAETFEIQFGPDGQKVKKIEIPTLTLVSAERDWGIRVTTKDLFLYTNRYDRFQSFEVRMREALGTLAKIFPIYHTGFLGMRFLNKFPYVGERSFTKVYKKPEFLQPTIENYNPAGSNLSAKYKTDVGWMNLNSGITVGGALLPPDIEQFSATLNPKDVNKICEGPWAHLDMDSHKPSNSLIKYDLDKIVETLSELRERANIFYSEIIKI
ncbi:TPA: TIGR04255 family protein [Klebsiella michiganensis]|uniref:TIGR04255 family protein n=1 Tax=Klebsiella TaxID=570 RepID=UPI0012B8CFDF|nr:TIGR04255 family protein [Klebsiella grimontii]HCB0413137.1 TIGR04255 family protein [Klebsiella pneumoniae]HDX8854758.1 TIGR04255 family protein [Klebsiella michiganensis]HEJ8504280.1 TIGR04255 family protein [Klebsiella oxytoca]